MNDILENLNSISNAQLQELLFDLAEEMKDRGFEDEGRSIQSISNCLE